MAESDGPSMPPQQKPKRESHFDSSWINDFNDNYSYRVLLVSGGYEIVTSVVLLPPPFYLVFDISNLLSYIQNNFSYELARPIMGTIFLVYYILYIVRAKKFVLITRKEGGA